MNFDDLHDPSPPSPGAATLAAVATRAKTLRRRRTAFTSVGAALAVVAVAVPAGLALRGDDSERLVPATMPSVEPDASVAVTGAPSPPTPSTDATVDGPRPLLTAVSADGVGIVVDDDGTSTVLKGADGGVPTGLEVRTVLLTPDRRSFVAVCCLPMTSPDEETSRWGEFLAGELDRPGAVRSMDMAASRLVVLHGGGVSVTGLDGRALATGRPAGDSTVVDVAYLPDGRLAVIDLFSGEAGFVGRLHVTDGDLSTLSASAGVTLGPVEGNGTWQLAGTDSSGNVLVAAGGDGAFDGSPRGYDADSLAEAASPPTTGAASVLTMWFDAGVGTWVDADGALWHDGERIPGGPYAWARPVPRT